MNYNSYVDGNSRRLITINYINIDNIKIYNEILTDNEITYIKQTTSNKKWNKIKVNL